MDSEGQIHDLDRHYLNEADRQQRRERWTTRLGAAMIGIAFVGLWSIPFLLVSVAIGNRSGAAVSGGITVGSGLLVAVLYKVLKVMSGQRR